MQILAAIFIIALYGVFVFLVIGGMWKTFTKAGQPGWACLIPFYNYIVMADVARVGRKTVLYMILSSLLIIPGVLILSTDSDLPISIFGVLFFISGFVLSLYFLFKIYKGIALNFGQSVGFAWGLMFLNVIFFAILGFGSARYQGGNYLNDDLLDSGI
jgi:hypothetical protein